MDVTTLIVLVVLGQTPEPSRDPAALVEKLGSASYAEREATQVAGKPWQQGLARVAVRAQVQGCRGPHAGQSLDQHD